MVMFFVAALMIAAAAALPNVATEGRREKEQEMIWRGNQYARAIKLYYRKTGRFPAELDDLYKPKLGSIRFLRQPYKDPMNKEDGSWRLIYVGQAGQLIGSLKPRSNLQLPAQGTPAGAVGAAPGGTAPGTPSTPASGTGAGTGQSGAAPGASGTTATPAGSGGGQSDATTGQGDQLPPGNVDSPTVFGGRIIGVGSKIDHRSVIYYDKARNYRLYEFIWDPSKDTGGSNQPLLSGPGNQPGQPGQTPANPNPNPPAPNPNPGGTSNPQ
jgi:hypothetical protein